VARARAASTAASRKYCPRQRRRSRPARQGPRQRAWDRAAASSFDAGDLGLAHRLVVDVQDFDLVFLLETVFVDADDHLVTTVDGHLAARRGLLDHPLGQPIMDGLGHAAHCLDLLDQLPGGVGKILGQALDIVGAGERIDDPRHACLVLEDKLGIACDPSKTPVSLRTMVPSAFWPSAGGR
jgi:hypothetical protein